MNHSFFSKLTKNVKKYNLIKIYLSESLVLMSKRANEQFAKERSDLLFFYERPERIAHGQSFVMSDLSDSLMVAYLS